MEIYEHYPLKGLSTFGIDVKAQRVLFLRGSTLDEAKIGRASCRERV